LRYCALPALRLQFRRMKLLPHQRFVAMGLVLAGSLWAAPSAWAQG
jgi:hypothetical protein